MIVDITMAMHWDYHTFMRQPEWFITAIYQELKRQSDEIKRQKK